MNQISELTSFLFSGSFGEIVCKRVCLGWTRGISLVCQEVELGNTLLEVLQLLWAGCLLNCNRMLRDTNRCPATILDLSGSQEPRMKSINSYIIKSSLQIQLKNLGRG